MAEECGRRGYLSLWEWFVWSASQEKWSCSESFLRRSTKNVTSRNNQIMFSQSLARDLLIIVSCTGHQSSTQFHKIFDRLRACSWDFAIKANNFHSRKPDESMNAVYSSWGANQRRLLVSNDIEQSIGLHRNISQVKWKPPRAGAGETSRRLPACGNYLLTSFINHSNGFLSGNQLSIINKTIINSFLLSAPQANSDSRKEENFSDKHESRLRTPKGNRLVDGA